MISFTWIRNVRLNEQSISNLGKTNFGSVYQLSSYFNDPFWLGKSFKISSGFTFFLSFAWPKTKTG